MLGRERPGADRRRHDDQPARPDRAGPRIAAPHDPRHQRRHRPRSHLRPVQRRPEVLGRQRGGTGRSDRRQPGAIPTPRQIGAATDPIAVAAGAQHTCIVSEGGGDENINCWGADGSEQLGDGTPIAKRDRHRRGRRVLVRARQRRRALLLGRQPLRPARDRRQHGARDARAGPGPGARHARWPPAARTPARPPTTPAGRARCSAGARTAAASSATARRSTRGRRRASRRWSRPGSPPARGTPARSPTDKQLRCWGWGASGQLGQPAGFDMVVTVPTATDSVSPRGRRRRVRGRRRRLAHLRRRHHLRVGALLRPQRRRPARQRRPSAIRADPARCRRCSADALASRRAGRRRRAHLRARRRRGHLVLGARRRGPARRREGIEHASPDRGRAGRATPRAAEAITAGARAHLRARRRPGPVLGPQRRRAARRAAARAAARRRGW